VVAVQDRAVGAAAGSAVPAAEAASEVEALAGPVVAVILAAADQEAAGERDENLSNGCEVSEA
jgi:hypothetical protein